MSSYFRPVADCLGCLVVCWHFHKAGADRLQGQYNNQIEHDSHQLKKASKLFYLFVINIPIKYFVIKTFIHLNSQQYMLAHKGTPSSSYHGSIWPFILHEFAKLSYGVTSCVGDPLCYFICRPALTYLLVTGRP